MYLKTLKLTLLLKKKTEKQTNQKKSLEIKKTKTKTKHHIETDQTHSIHISLNLYP